MPFFKFTTPRFVLPLTSSGSGMLEEYPVVQSVTPILVYRYTGAGCGPTFWNPDKGNILNTLGSGTDPTLNKPAPFTLSGERAVGYNYGKYHREGGAVSSFGNIDNVGTRFDFILEIAVKMPPTADYDETILAKWDSSTNTGYKLWREAATRRIKLTLGDGVGTVDIQASAGWGIRTADDSTWYYYIFYVDREHPSISTGARFTVNASNNASYDVSGIGFTYTTSLLTIGASSTAPLQEFGGDVTYVALYRSPEGWLDRSDTTEYTRFVRERTCKLWGIYPTYAEGQQYPTLLDRSGVTTDGGTAMLDIYSETDGYSHGHLVGRLWNRVCKRKSKNNEIYIGLLPELGSGTGYNGYNRFDALADSEDFSDVGWTKTGATISTNAVASPIDDVIADAINGTAIDESHGVEVISTDGSGWVTVFAKKGEVDFLYIESSNAFNPNGPQWCYFDLNNGTVGSRLVNTSNGGQLIRGLDAYMMQEYQDGWFRCGIGSYNGNPTTFKIYAVDSDQGIQGPTYTASTNPQIYLWGAQHNNYMLYVCSYRRKDSRNDDIRFSAIDNMGPQDEEGLIKLSMFMEGNQNQDSNLFFSATAGGDISIGTSYTNHQGGIWPAPSAYISYSLSLNGSYNDPSLILNDGYSHEIALEWRPTDNDFDDILYLDEEAIDSGQGPLNQGTSLETMFVGNIEFGGLIWGIEFRTLDDITGPIVCNQAPASLETNVDRLTNITFDIVDPETSVDPDSITLGGELTPLIYSDGTFYSPFDNPNSSISPTSIPEGDGYHIVLDRNGWFGSGEAFSVEVIAANNCRKISGDSFGFTPMSTNGPDAYDPYPPDGYSNVDRNIIVDAIIVDGYYPIDPDTVEFVIEGNTAYQSGSFISPYDGPGSIVLADSYGGKDGYRVYVDKIGVYVNNDTVEFRIQAEDISGVEEGSTYSFTTENDITKDIGVSIEEGLGTGFVPAYDGATGAFVPPYNGPLSQMYPDSSDGYDGYSFIIQKTSQWDEAVRVSVQVGNASFENTMADEFEDNLYNRDPLPFALDVSRTSLARFRIRLSDESPELGPDWEVFAMGGEAPVY